MCTLNMKNLLFVNMFLFVQIFVMICLHGIGYDIDFGPLRLLFLYMFLPAKTTAMLIAFDSLRYKRYSRHSSAGI